MKLENPNICICEICGGPHASSECPQSRPEILAENPIFTQEQLSFLKNEGSWVVDRVLKSYEEGTKFTMKPTWGVFQEKYGFCTEEEFYGKVLQMINERCLAAVTSALSEANERFYVKLAHVLKNKGVLFLDETRRFSMAIAFYDDKKNCIVFRPEKIRTHLITTKHELIHGAVYNLPADAQRQIRKQLQEQLDLIKNYLQPLSDAETEFIKERYQEGNIVYGVSNTDELIAHLTNPTFQKFLKDLQEGNLFEKTTMQKLKEKVLKPKRISLQLDQILAQVFGYWERAIEEMEAGKLQ